MRAFLAVALWAVAARGESWKVQLEAGSGYDSNVHRASGEDADPAFVAQAGGRFSGADRLGETFRLAGSALALGRAFAGTGAGRENILVLQGDLQADAVLGDVAPGLRVSYYDALGSSDETTNLTFRTGEVAAHVALRRGGHRADAFAGWRGFHYKPDDEVDFSGERLGLRYRYTFPGEENVWALQAGYSVNRRAYGARALANGCPSGEPPNPACLIETDRDRVDLFHDAALELSFTSILLASARYHLMVNDSSSFGQSLLRHRVELAATLETFFDIVLNLELLLQFNRYPDGLILEPDLGTFTTIDDETRNALIVHLTREIGDGWMLEARYAFYASPFAPDVASYNRHSLYLGVVVSFGE